MQTVMELSADPSISSDANNQLSKFEQFTTKTAENLFNYCSSFANSIAHFATIGQVNPNQQLVPLNVINEWYTRFIRNLKQNPNFWR